MSLALVVEIFQTKLVVEEEEEEKQKQKKDCAQRSSDDKEFPVFDISKENG